MSAAPDAPEFRAHMEHAAEAIAKARRFSEASIELSMQQLEVEQARLGLGHTSPRRLALEIAQHYALVGIEHLQAGRALLHADNPAIEQADAALLMTAALQRRIEDELTQLAN